MRCRESNENTKRRSSLSSCRSPPHVVDCAAGDRVCTNCGDVGKESIRDFRPEWRALMKHNDLKRDLRLPRAGAWFQAMNRNILLNCNARLFPSISGEGGGFNIQRKRLFNVNRKADFGIQKQQIAKRSQGCQLPRQANENDNRLTSGMSPIVPNRIRTLVTSRKGGCKKCECVVSTSAGVSSLSL